VLIEPLHLIVWIEKDCGAVGGGVVAETVVFIKLLPAKIDAGLEVRGW